MIIISDKEMVQAKIFIRIRDGVVNNNLDINQFIEKKRMKLKLVRLN